MIIAIDGTAASGKGTIAVLLANRINAPHLDSGKIYRLVGTRAEMAGIDQRDDEHLLEILKSISLTDLSNPHLSSENAAISAAKFAINGKLRLCVTKWIRSQARDFKDIVIDGRDIGTEVFPDATVKLFFDADPTVRAIRRAKESGQCDDSIVRRIKADLVRRDQQDREREHGKFRVASDAIVIDTTNLSIEEAFASALAAVEARRA